MVYLEEVGKDQRTFSWPLRHSTNSYNSRLQVDPIQELVIHFTCVPSMSECELKVMLFLDASTLFYNDLNPT